LNVLRFSAEQYRNLKPVSIPFSPNINVIYGKNAQGKTNLLEAIWLFTGGHSFRGASDKELVQFGSPSCRLSLEFFSENREQIIDLTVQNGKRFFAVNGVEKRSGADLIGKFCGVIFSPEHLSLVKGGPSMRRSFLDGALCQSYPTYARDFVQYQRTLRQRNSLLKEIGKNPSLQSTLEIWNRALSERGIQVISQRRSLVKFIREPVQQIYGGLSQQKETIDLQYDSSVGGTEFDTIDHFLERLKATEKQDLATGYTSVGPHRDDLVITIDGNSARLFGSQGQQRSAVLSLKLAEAAILERLTGEKPVVLLDDVMSELDRDRQDYLLNQVRDRQIFITCCDPSAIESLKGGAAYLVEDGVVTAPKS
jgi:DNA replication and repair protein RecF